jgi:polyhydroxyalkanoate synthesis regulator phasin
MDGSRRTTMARAKKNTSTIPSFGQIEKQVGRLRKDLERTVDRVGRQATRYIPKSSRRQINEIIDNVGDLAGNVSKRVTKTVETVRADVEDSVFDLRGTVDKRVKALRKDAVDRSEKAVETVEREARKQLERVLRVLGVAQKADVDGVKKRLTALERKVEDLIETLKADESEAA